MSGAGALDLLASLLAIVRVETARCGDAASRLCWQRAQAFVRELLADYERTGRVDRIVPRLHDYVELRGDAHPVAPVFRRELARHSS